jgi:hypothetical protein
MAMAVTILPILDIHISVIQSRGPLADTVPKDAALPHARLLLAGNACQQFITKFIYFLGLTSKC